MFGLMFSLLMKMKSSVEDKYCLSLRKDKRKRNMTGRSQFCSLKSLRRNLRTEESEEESEDKYWASLTCFKGKDKVTKDQTANLTEVDIFIGRESN